MLTIRQACAVVVESVQIHQSRILLFVTALLPSTTWLLSEARLVHPVEILLWTIVCATALAFPPGQLGATCSAWLQLLLTPLTIIWIGTVATTGTGPSAALLDAALTAGQGEVSASVHTAFKQPSGIVIALLSITGGILAIRAARKTPKKSSNSSSLLFVATLLAISVVIIDRDSVVRLAPWEAKSAVPLFSHLVMMQESQRILHFGFVQSRAEWKPAAAEKLFQARKGLAVFVVGESMRADALIRDDRGPWSRLLRDRLAQGLGARAADACAYGNSTQLSVPRLFTAVAIDDSSELEAKPTILAMTKAAGATTAYIFNHVPAPVKEGGHDLIVNVSSLEYSTYDDLIVEAFADFVARDDKDTKAAILHLRGQHYLYANRYPSESFDPKPENLSDPALEKLEYDRAAEYGVKVLLDLARILDDQSEPAYLIFTSDHGENLLADGTGKRYHAGPWPSRYDTIVPVLFLWNQAFVRSGRVKEIEPLLKAEGLIAHRDVARSWLILAGLPEQASVTKNPKTLIPLSSRSKKATMACSELTP